MSEWVEKMTPDRSRMMLRGALDELATVEDILAEMLGYPRGDGGPDDPSGGSWIIGEHTAVSLAMEARARFLPQDTDSERDVEPVVIRVLARVKGRPEEHELGSVEARDHRAFPALLRAIADTYEEGL